MSPLDGHKSALVSLVISVIQGREKALVVAGLDLWCGVLTLPGYLEPKEVGVWYIGNWNLHLSYHLSRLSYWQTMQCS